jgi:hypothetical protein
MPIPTPNSGETEGKFVSRCIGFLITEGMPNNQAAAICYDKWRKKDTDEELDAILPVSGEFQATRVIHFKEGDKNKMSKITEIYDDIQEGNPTRAQGNRTVGQGTGYAAPEAVVAGRDLGVELPEDIKTPRSTDQDLDDLFPIADKE